MKDTILKVAGNNYNCLENFEVVTISNDSDDLALSCEIDGDELSVNIIDADNGIVIDNYSTELNDDNVEDKIHTAVATFENIQKLKKNNKLKLKKESTNEVDQFKNKNLEDLSEEDLIKLEKCLKNSHLGEVLSPFIEFYKQNKDNCEDKEVLNEDEEEQEVNLNLSEATLDNVDCDVLISNVIKRVQNAEEVTEDETSKVILEDIALQLDGIRGELANLQVI